MKTLVVLLLPALAFANPVARGPFPAAQTSSCTITLINPPLLNGWQNYGPPFGGATYYKDCDGVVHFEGAIKGGNGPAFDLPAGYRPMNYVLFPAAGSANVAEIHITADGSVNPVGIYWGGVGGAPVPVISLHGVRFRAP